MKKIFLIVLVLILSLCGCTNDYINQNQQNKNNNYKNEIRSVWISYFELSKFTIDKSEQEFRKSFNEALLELKNIGFNTITVQIRPCADAFYKSKYFPSSKYCFGKQGIEMPYDPFKIICELARSNNINIEAWINPYRVSQNNKIEELCDANIAKQWYKSKDKSRNVFECNNKIYFNPASLDVINLIVAGVVEIIENYHINGIHFDDYFYPTQNKEIDKQEYTQYTQSNGKLSLNDWRRENINTMVKSVYNAVKKSKKNIKFGISPSGNINDNYNKLYADVKLWASSTEYLDYICPQIYYGFENEKLPFINTVKEWASFTNIDLRIGLPLYKSGKLDKYASKSDKSIQREFIENKDIIARQINYIEKFDKIDGYYIFSYNSLFDNKSKEEVSNLMEVMRNSNQDTHQQN